MNQFSPSQITYLDVKKQQNVAVVQASFENESPVYFSIHANIKNEHVHVLTSKAYIDILIEDSDSIQQFLAFDEYNINTVFEKSEQWFSQQIPIEIIREYYQPILNKRKGDGSYFIRTKISSLDGLPRFMRVTKKYSSVDGSVVDEKQEEIDHLDSYDSDSADIILEYKGMKFGKQTFWCDLYFDTIEHSEVVTVKEEEEIVLNDSVGVDSTRVDGTPVDSGIVSYDDNISVSVVESAPSALISELSENIATEVSQTVKKELTELTPEDLDKVVVFENISIRANEAPIEIEEKVFTFDHEDDINVEKRNRMLHRKNVVIERQTKYLSSLEELKNKVEDDVRQVLQKRDKINEKYALALEEYNQLENSFDYTTDDEIIEDYIVENTGSLSRRNSEDFLA